MQTGIALTPKYNPAAISRAAEPESGITVNLGWQRLLEAYISQKDCARESIRTYKKALIQYFRWLDQTGRRLDSCAKRDIVEWKRSLYASGHSTMTVSLYMVAVKGFYQWTESIKAYPNIAKDVKGATVRERGTDEFVKFHLTDEQGKQFLDYFRQKGNIRDYALMNLMIRTGLRSVEVYRADIGDIRTEAGRMKLIVQGKGQRRKSEGVFVVLSNMVYRPLMEYLNSRDDGRPDSPLFTCEGRNCHGRRLSTRTIQSIAKEGLRAIGLDSHSYSVHSLRHTAAVTILKNGGTQFDVQDVLRHASVNTSQIYLESIKKERRLASAPELLIDKAFGGE